MQQRWHHASRASSTRLSATRPGRPAAKTSSDVNSSFAECYQQQIFHARTVERLIVGHERRVGCAAATKHASTWKQDGGGEGDGQQAWPARQLELRSYQRAAVEAVLSCFKLGLVQQLVGMPTGSGKTITFATLARIMDCRTLILVNRAQLMDQTVEAIRRVWPEVEVGCLQGKRNQLGAQVVVATVQTAYQEERLNSLHASEEFGLCIVDEAHHAPADTYQKVLGRLGFLSGDPQKLLLGVTATPYRSCKLLLSDTFQAQTYDIAIGELIRNGALCNIQAQRILTCTDLTEAQLKAPRKAKADTYWNDVADFNQEQLSLLINTTERNQLVASSYRRLANGRKAIAFACSIEHADAMADEFNRQGVSAASLHSKLTKWEQTLLLQKHRNGDIQVLTNVGMLTEGYDDASISCVLMTRPTRSRALYTQCVGRGFRTSPGKEDCLVLDFTDTRHTLDRLSDLMDIKCVVQGQGVELRNYDREPAGTGEALERVIPGGELWLYEKMEYAWVRYDTSLYLSLWCTSPAEVYLQLRPLSGQEVADLETAAGSTGSAACSPGSAESSGQIAADAQQRDEQEAKHPREMWQLSYLIESSSDPWTPDMWRPLERIEVTRGGEMKARLRAVQSAEARLKALQRAAKTSSSGQEQTNSPSRPKLADYELLSEFRLFLQSLHMCKVEGRTETFNCRQQPCYKMQRQRILDYGIKEHDMRQWIQEGAFLGQGPASPSASDSSWPPSASTMSSSTSFVIERADGSPLLPSPSSSAPSSSASDLEWVEGLTFGQASDVLTLLHIQSRLKECPDLVSDVQEEPKAPAPQQLLEGLRFWATAARLVKSSAQALVEKTSALFDSIKRSRDG